MSDNRNITGTVSVEQQGIAATAYKMAFALWSKEHGKGPKASDDEFFSLVAKCARALRGQE